MTSIEDQYLLQKLKEDDIHALETLFNKYYGNLTRYLLLIFKNQLLVEHITQDIFVYLWENRKTIKISTSFESYLYAACRYKAINQIRNIKRQEKIKEDMRLNQQTTALGSDSMIEIRELEQIIDEAIDTLPERCRQIFRLSREENMSYKEIARAKEVS